MSAEIIQLRDFQNPKDLERMQRELEKEAAKILETLPVSEQGIPCVDRFNRAMGISENIPYGGQGIDGMDLGKEPV